jgi:hypothetical protein
MCLSNLRQGCVRPTKVGNAIMAGIGSRRLTSILRCTKKSKLARLSPNSIFQAAIEVGKTIAKFDIWLNSVDLYIRIYKLARTPNIEYGTSDKGQTIPPKPQDSFKSLSHKEILIANSIPERETKSHNYRPAVPNTSNNISD